MKPESCSLAYCYYYATGEGVTVLLAVAGSAHLAERLFTKRAHEYFRTGMVVVSLDDCLDEEAKYVVGLIPTPVLDLLRKNPRGTTQYFSELHYNLA